MELLVKLGQHNSLQSQRWRETREQILIVVIGALVLVGWLVVAKNFSAHPRQILGGFNSYVVANAIFLIFIPDSIHAVIIRWVDVSKQLCITKSLVFRSEQDFVKKSPAAPTAVEIPTKVSCQDNRRSVALSYAIPALLATLVGLFFACLSGGIGAEQTVNKRSWEFLLSVPLFLFQIIRLSLLVRRLLTTIIKILRPRQ